MSRSTTNQPINSQQTQDDEVARLIIEQRSPAVQRALDQFDDDAGGAIFIGGWKRPRTS